MTRPDGTSEIPGLGFRAHPWLRNAHVQSLLASSALRRASVISRAREVLSASREVILDAGQGIRLQGFLSKKKAPEGLVVLLHGWEGCSDSTYILDIADYLWRAGYSVFRLNFRDHGDTHHLNEDLFHSCRLDEVVQAIVSLADRVDPRRLYLTGFSLGGNFSLRVALKAPALGLNIDHVVSVSPVINPAAGLEAIESAPWFYQAYFMRKWRKSLARKSELFEKHRDLKVLLKADMRDLTASLVERYTDFPDLDAYLDGYSVAGDRLQGLIPETTIVTSMDDPVIPLEDFHHLQLPDHVRLVITQHGGHCGFIQGLDFASWVPPFVVQTFKQAQQKTELVYGLHSSAEWGSAEKMSESA